jgi:hypothetical protein
MAGRCHGDCCRQILLKVPPERLGAASRGGGNGYKWGGVWHPPITDASKLFAMLVPKGKEGGLYAYSCRLLLPNGDCFDYEGRPTMCREYPNGHPCPHPGCTLDEVRHGL